ncbi:MAG: OadG family protein [Oscillospiraceae bacterium]|nr:OadG family protein [Oscillospiraceae bacterium]
MDWYFVFSVVATGLSVVFLILLVLIIILMFMGRILSTGKRPARIKTRRIKELSSQIIIPKSGTIPQTPPQVFLKSHNVEGDELQIIAVITAVIAAYNEKTGKKHKIIGIQKREGYVRSAWGNAGVSENTR